MMSYGHYFEFLFIYCLVMCNDCRSLFVCTVCGYMTLYDIHGQGAELCESESGKLFFLW
jgi:hypothetical protein